MADFHWLRPWWLIALLPLLALYLVLWLQQRRAQGWQQWLAQHLTPLLLEKRSTALRHGLLHCLALAWVIATTAMAGPTWQRMPQPVYQLQSGQVIVMDMSLSMRSDDIEPDRVARARFKAMDLLRAGLDGDTGLVAYAGDAFVISPLTSDKQNLLTLIPSLSPEIMPEPGSHPLQGLKQAQQLLTNAGYEQGDIYWITDGIQTRDQQPIVDFIRQHDIRLSILGVASESGAPIRLQDGRLLKDRSGAVVVPTINHQRLRGLAELSGGRYAAVSADDSDINYLTSQAPLSLASDDHEQSREGDQWQDNGVWLALLLLPLALLPWRRGGALGALGLPLLGMSLLGGALVSSSTAYAQENWWQRQDQRAQQAYQEKSYDKAQQLAEDPLLRGNAAYRQQQYEQALTDYAQVDSAQGWYNQGNALMQLEQYTQAVNAYKEALQKQPDLAQAKQNLALAEQLKQQQQQEQEQQQQGDQQQQGQGQAGQQGQQGESGEQQDGEQQDSEQQDGEPSEQAQPSPADNQQQQQPGDQQPQAQPQQPQSPEQQQQQQAQQTDEGDEGEQQPWQQHMQDLDEERARQLEQWLNRVPDDPSILLRNKMQLEYRQRRLERRQPPQGVDEEW